MEAYGNKELLCFSGGNGRYAIEIPYITEICTELMVSSFPCLPRYFSGVCNYKGNIVPVVHMGIDDGQRYPSVIIVKDSRYMLGIEVMEEPYIISGADTEKIEMQGGDFSSEILEIKEFLRTKKELLTVIDMKKTLEHLVVNKE